MVKSDRLSALPSELLLDIHLLAVEPALAIVNRHIHLVMSSASVRYRAEWLVRRVPTERYDTGLKLDRMLRYGVCRDEVFFDHVLPLARADWTARPWAEPVIEIPRRLYRAGSTPQRQAIDRTIVEALLELRHPLRDARVEFGRGTAALLRRVIEAGELELARRLCGRDHVGLDTCLPAAIEAGDADLVNRIVYGYGGPSPQVWPTGMVPLFKPSSKALQLAIDRGHRPIVHLLISLGAKPTMAHLRRLERS